MELKPLHIVNAQLIDGETPRAGSLLVVDGRIAAIDPTDIPEGTETVDAKGQWLAPVSSTSASSRPTSQPFTSAASRGPR